LYNPDEAKALTPLVKVCNLNNKEDSMFNRLKGHQGFTLIELMIVVAIIGILAAIAIPNFLQYQLRARQTEARTNTMGIKTSMVSYSGTVGCTPGITANPAGAPTGARQAWGVLALTANLCNVGGVFTGSYQDIGFSPSGNVFYQYVVVSNPAPAVVPLAPGLGAAAAPGTRNPCVAIPALPAPGGAAVNAGFQVIALGNLDADINFSNFSADDATGATDCVPGIF
jgi:type IV pilus assembly protein PilA